MYKKCVLITLVRSSKRIELNFFPYLSGSTTKSARLISEAHNEGLIFQSLFEEYIWNKQNLSKRYVIYSLVKDYLAIERSVLKCKSLDWVFEWLTIVTTNVYRHVTVKYGGVTIMSKDQTAKFNGLLKFVESTIP